MQRIFLLAALVGSFTLSLGCGNGEMIKTRGHVVRDGEDFEGNDDLSLEVYFVPIDLDGGASMHCYTAEVDQDTGRFVAAGGHNKGMPPGRYRVGVEVLEKKKDTLNGKFNGKNSPFEFDLDSNSEELIIDLENPPSKS